MSLSKPLESSGIGSMQETANEATSGSLDLFTPLVRETGMDSFRECSYLPSSMQSAGPFDIFCPAEGELYVDLSTVRLEGKVRIMKKDTNGTLINLVEDDKVAPVNLFPYALFKAIECSISNVQISFISTPNSNYKNYLTNLLSYGSDAANTHLSTSLFAMDTAGAFNDFTGKNLGLTKRQSWVAKSKKFDFCVPLSNDIFSLDRLIPPGVDIRIKMTRADDSFALMTPDTDTNSYSIVIDELVLHVRKIKVNPDVVAEHKRLLTTKKWYTFPIVRSTIKSAGQIAKDQTYLNVPNLFRGRLPTNIIIGLVSSDAYNGSIHKNPFCFDNYSLSKIYLTVNAQNVPSKPLEPDFDNDLYARAYRHMFDNSGVLIGNHSTLVTKDLFKSGVTLFCTDLSPDLCLNFHCHKETQGSIQLNLSLAKGAPESITVLCWASYSDVFHMDSDGNAFLTHSGQL